MLSKRAFYTWFSKIDLFFPIYAFNGDASTPVVSATITTPKTVDVTALNFPIAVMGVTSP